MLTKNTIMLEQQKNYSACIILMHNIGSGICYIYTRVSGCSIWNVIHKHSSCSPEAKPRYDHVSLFLAVVAKGYVHVSACGILRVMRQHSG